MIEYPKCSNGNLTQLKGLLFRCAMISKPTAALLAYPHSILFKLTILLISLRMHVSMWEGMCVGACVCEGPRYMFVYMFVCMNTYACDGPRVMSGINLHHSST